MIYGNFAGPYCGPAILLLLISISVRIVVFAFDTSFFGCYPPALDEDFYFLLIKLIDEKSPLIFNEPFYYSPLFLYTLYFLYKLFGNNFTEIVIILNIILSSLTSYLIFLILREINPCCDKRAFFVALFFSLLDIMVFYSLTYMKVSLGIFLITVYIFLLIKNRFFLAGIFAGLSVLIYGGILFTSIAVFLYLIYRKKLFSGFKFLLPIIIVVSFSAYINYNRSSDLVLITATDGIHFFIGNWKKASGFYTPVPGIRPNPFGHYFDAKRLAEFIERKSLKPSEVSRFWKVLALKHISENPERWLKILGKKLIMSVNYNYFPNNYNLKVIREKTLLRFSIPFTSAFMLGLAGFLIVLLKLKRSSESLTIINIFFISYILFLIAFFITDRYRLPLLIPLSVYIYILLTVNLSLWKKIITLLLSLIIVLTPVNIHITPDYRKIELARKLCMLKKDLETTKDTKVKSNILIAISMLYINLNGREWAEFYLKEALKFDKNNRKALILLRRLRNL